MGYYTRFELEFSPKDNVIETEVIEDQYKTLYGGECDPFDDACKWYEHEQDMRAFSKKHPKKLFILKGEGEEAGDIWVKYFQDGKMQTCKAEIVFPEFDARQMK